MGSCQSQLLHFAGPDYALLKIFPDNLDNMNSAVKSIGSDHRDRMEKAELATICLCRFHCRTHIAQGLLVPPALLISPNLLPLGWFENLECHCIFPDNLVLRKDALRWAKVAAGQCWSTWWRWDQLRSMFGNERFYPCMTLTDYIRIWFWHMTSANICKPSCWISTDSK